MSETSTRSDAVEGTTAAAAESAVYADEYGTRQRGPGLGSAKRGVRGWLKWGWYSLTSMRTALILLFLLALASVPGSILPQRGSDPGAVARFIASHKTTGPFLDWIGAFNVFAAPWFFAVYALLFLSLAGCVLPRARRHLASARAKPPAAPRNLSRLPLADRWETDLPAADAVAACASFLRRRRFRTVVAPDGGSVAAEKGHLRETGNVVFHLSLLVVLVGVAFGSVHGFTGNVVVNEGDGFASTRSQYDIYTPGRLFTESDLTPFEFTLNKFDIDYVTTGPGAGTPKAFDARVTYRPDPDAAPRDSVIRVNHPLSIGSTNIYLANHGYAPEFIIKDPSGRVVFDGNATFMPGDTKTFLSHGVVKASAAEPQIGIAGVLLPTAVQAPDGEWFSLSPIAGAPVIIATVYEGDLGFSSGIPQSVYVLETSKMKQVAHQALPLGATMTLPDGSTVEFAGLKQWASFQMTSDPGKKLVLAAVAAAVLGLLLSLGIRRRRMWVRASAGDGGRTVVEVGGLSRTDASGGFDEEFERLANRLREAIPPSERSKEG